MREDNSWIRDMKSHEVSPFVCLSVLCGCAFCACCVVCCVVWCNVLCCVLNCVCIELCCVKLCAYVACVTLFNRKKACYPNALVSRVTRRGGSS